MNKWLIIGAVLLLLILGVFAYRRAQNKVVAKASVASTAGVLNAASQGDTAAEIGAPGVVLTRSACNQIARGRCGRRPLLNNARGRAVRDCWKDVRISVCNWDANRAANEGE